ncbi:unnamed protein product, partial [Choristocarpus tenellus]
YLGGLLDLTGEICRYGVAKATERDSVALKQCLETIVAIHDCATMNTLPGKLFRKKRELTNSLQKLENMTYELALLKAGKGIATG